MNKHGLSDVQDVQCDGVPIGQIGRDNRGRYVAVSLSDQVVAKGECRPSIYRELRALAHQQGLLVRVRKGVYRAADNQAQG